MSIIELSERIKDPRNDKNKIHEASTIVFIALVGVLCGCDTWNEIQMFGESNIEYFEQRLPNMKGIPSHDTFNRFFSALDTKVFEEIFREWVNGICKKISGVIAIDGKAVCPNPEYEGKDKSSVRSKLYMVSAWSVANGICFGQEKVSDMSNEITAIPLLIEALDIEGCTITIDAMGCQKAIAELIREKKAHYILAAKDNQKKLKRRIEFNLDDEKLWNKELLKRYCTTECAHGREETRECVCMDFSPFARMYLKGWKDANTLVKIISTRRNGNEKPTIENRFYITSLPEDPKLILESIRSHWQVENVLHWRLDVAFREDYTRKKGNAAINFSVISKIAMELLKTNKKKVGLASKRKACGWDIKLRDEVLGIKL